MKISFLIPAHNEEKIIGRTLSHLLKLPYKNYEILIGLDGCTDRTEDIVKSFADKSKKIKYLKTNFRKGKPPVIDSLMKKASGDIIIINDADWLFTVKDSKSFKRFISVFNDKNVGGIAESFPVEWDKINMKSGNIGYKMVSYSSFFWFSFQKEKFSSNESKELSFISEPSMFLTNIFRKKLYKRNFSLGDDFERTHNIISQRYKIVLFNNTDMPRMIATYTKIPLGDLFKQKVRTALARRQIKHLRDKEDLSESGYYIQSIFYMLRKSFLHSFSAGFLVTLWILLTSLASFYSSFKSFSTREGWALRINRR